MPSLWRLFLANRGMFGPELEAVRWVEIGSQYMSQAEKSALRTALPRAKIVQHYGLTEASRTTFLKIHAVAEADLASVGRPEGAVEVRINQSGRIETRGPHVALGIQDGTTYRALGPEAWFETSDLGHVDAAGLVHYGGRADDIINCGGIKLSPDLVEEHLRRAVPEAGVGSFGVLRQDDPLRGDGILLALTAESAPHRAALVDAIADYAAGLGLSARGAITTREITDLPRTETGKVAAQTLGRRAGRHPRPPRGPCPGTARGFPPVLTSAFGRGCGSGAVVPGPGRRFPVPYAAVPGAGTHPGRGPA